MFAVDLDLDAHPTFAQMQEIFDEMVKAEYPGSYFIHADSETMEQDEGEAEWAYYSIEPEDLARETPLPLPTDEAEVFDVLVRAILEDLAGEVIEAEVATLTAAYQARVVENQALKAANSTMAPGTPVHLGCTCGISYPDPAPVAFDAARHDARTVLPDSAVDYAEAKGKLTIHPLPPHMVKKNGKYWAGLPDDRATFMGQTKRALEAKAAIHLAWTKEFGAH